MNSITIIIGSPKNMARYQDKDFLVSVEGWSKPREIHWRGPDLFMELTAKDCLCGTCIKRFESVLFSMRDRNISYEAGTWSKKDCCVKFENPKGFEESKIAAYLSKRIGLKVKILKEIKMESEDS